LVSIFGEDGWGVCRLTEAGFVRVTTNPVYRLASRTIAQATAILADFANHPGYRYWPISPSWADLTAPFSAGCWGISR
jgi:predicted nucleic acid-binding protein